MINYNDIERAFEEQRHALELISASYRDLQARL